MKKILVTGGAGFLGSHLCERLVARGHHVLCVDNYFTGSKSNIQHLLSNANFEVIRHDVCVPLYVEVDEIYNMACPASPKSYQKDPIQTMKTSFMGSYNLLGLAKRTKAKIFQASTSEIYGDPFVHPQPESYWGNVNPLGPRACYDEGKRAAETLFMDYNRQHNVDVRVARIFNTYGPRMSVDDGRVVSNFIVQALQGLPLSVYGEGTQTRSFCYVDDLIDGILTLMESTSSGSQPVNLGNPHEVTVRSLAEQIQRLTGSTSRILNLPLPVDDPQQRQADITRATSILGWEPKIPLEQGLQKTIAYFQQVLANA
jgi:UDP-glucuronate decarboxylase